MSAPSRRAVLQLYRDLLRYGRKLEFTDKEYYFLRIRHEFQANKDLQDPEDITRGIKVSDHRVSEQNRITQILIRRLDISS